MKKGQVVKCVKPDESASYLTEGKLYTVMAGEGDVEPRWGRIIPSDTGFTVVNDYGRTTYCIYPACAHATWELVS